MSFAKGIMIKFINECFINRMYISLDLILFNRTKPFFKILQLKGNVYVKNITFQTD